VFAAIAGGDEQPAIVIEIPKKLLPHDLETAGTRRIEVAAAEFPGLPEGRGAVVVRLRDSQFEDLFGQLGVSLVQEIKVWDNARDAIHGVLRQIERWRRFLERSRQTLAPEDVRGLIGELSVLERLVSKLDAPTALSAWKAPVGSIRDFECEDLTIEVKTYMQSTGASVQINDPLQLQPEPNRPLFLACLELAGSTLTEFRLPGHVARVARCFADDLVLREDFEDALASRGYLPAHAGLYLDGYSIGSTRLFMVRDDFPRIKPTDIPPAVSSVRFALEILPLVKFAVDPVAALGQPRP
jgi:hypothetical protein